MALQLLHGMCLWRAWNGAAHTDLLAWTAATPKGCEL